MLQSAMTYKTTLTRLRAEYLEMPGLRLTREQAQRLCGIERALCKAVLDTLVGENFLCVKPDGSYARVTDGAIRSPVVKTAVAPERRFATAS
jgi:hypothetical protein